MSARWVGWYALGAVSMLLALLAVGALPLGLDRAALEAEKEAMETCMANAGRFGCRMDVADFIRYYEIKRQLEGK